MKVCGGLPHRSAEIGAAEGEGALVGDQIDIPAG